MAHEKKSDLVEVIRANPGCVAVIADIGWDLYTDDTRTIVLATEDTVTPRGDGGHGSGRCYGGDLLQALAVIAGIKVSSG